MLVTPMRDSTWDIAKLNTLAVPAGTFLDVDDDTLTVSKNDEL